MHEGPFLSGTLLSTSQVRMKLRSRTVSPLLVSHFTDEDAKARRGKQPSQGPASSNASPPARSDSKPMFLTQHTPTPSLILFTSRKNSLFEFVSEHHLNCPRELLAKAKGANLFKDENTVVRRALQSATENLGFSSPPVLTAGLLAFCAAAFTWKDRLGGSGGCLGRMRHVNFTTQLSLFLLLPFSLSLSLSSTNLETLLLHEALF